MSLLTEMNPRYFSFNFMCMHTYTYSTIIWKDLKNKENELLLESLFYDATGPLKSKQE